MRLSGHRALFCSKLVGVRRSVSCGRGVSSARMVEIFHELFYGVNGVWTAERDIWGVKV